MVYKIACFLLLTNLGAYKLAELAKDYAGQYAPLASLIQPLVSAAAAFAVYKMQKDPEFDEDYERQMRDIEEMGLKRKWLQ